MSIATYFTRIGKRITDVAAIVMSAGAADAGKIAALSDDGRWHPSLMPTGVVPDVTVLVASEALAIRAQVNIWDDAGVSKARNADASNGRKSDGYVLAAVALGEQASIYHEGAIEGFAGLVPGELYFLSDSVPGGISADPVVRAVGKIHQAIGTAANATKLVYEADPNPIYFA